jgi:uncharacterized membrane protein
MVGKFYYEPGEHEAEKASNSYLMSLIAVIAGLPFPIINLMATLFFYIGNRKGTSFVRWHCTQALLSQLSLLFVNSYGFWWTVSIIFTPETITNKWVAYMLTIFIFNLADFVSTIYAAIQTRKGIHVEWWFFGELTNRLIRSEK